MISELEAFTLVLKDVAAGGAHVVRNAATTPVLPYLLVEPQNATPFVESTLLYEDGELDITVRVKAVGASPTSCLIALRQARAQLVAGGRRDVLSVVGRFVEVEYVRHEADYIDTQTTLPATGNSVCLSIDTYRLTSQPA